MKQVAALNILKSGKNVFLTGSAGSGKTYTLNKYIQYLRARKISVATTASTGIAATHMNGVTIHSWSGIGIKDELSERDLSNLSRKQVLKDRLKTTAVLIIDEISMLHAKQLTLVDQVLKHVRNSNEPFGGIQLVVAGDFFQLPPIGNRNETNRDKFAFMSPAWLQADLKICYLNEQHRQETNSSHQNVIALDDILNQIRGEDGVTVEAIEALRNTVNQNVDINRTRLYTHNINVNNINEKELALLNTESVTYAAVAHGDNKLVETLRKTVRTNDELTLKVGAKVMFVKNNNEMGVSNGTMGELIGFTSTSTSSSNMVSTNKTSVAKEADKNLTDEATSHDEDTAKTKKVTENQSLDSNSANSETKKTDILTKAKYPIVRLNSGRKVVVEPEEWMIEGENGDVLASYTQIPLGLAWAITIHKSQGMTLDAAEIDLSQTFELGQGYVALSRLKSLDGLKLLGMNDMSLRLDPLARGADARFRELSSEIEEVFESLDNEELMQAQNEFVLKSGGSLNQKYIKAFEKRQQQRQDRQQKNQQVKDKLSTQLSNHSKSTLIETRLLIEESLTIPEVAQERGLAQSTIVGHIARLRKQDKNFNCDHLQPDSQIIEKVAKAVTAIIESADPNDFSAVDESSGDTNNGMDENEPIMSKHNIKLRPIYEYLKEKIDYNTIRLALIFVD